MILHVVSVVFVLWFGLLLVSFFLCVAAGVLLIMLVFACLFALCFFGVRVLLVLYIYCCFCGVCFACVVDLEFA